jgi:hypothetical protein
MDEFLNSKAMLTPGVAGALTTTITGTLVSQFGLPGNWTGLVISLLLGLAVWADKSVAIYQRIVFYAVNSMTIFAVAIGINTAGMAIEYSRMQSVEPPVVEREVLPDSERFFQEWFPR